MAGQIVSYNFTATLSAVSGSIAIGDWLVKDSTGSAYVKATSANRTTVGGYVEGISLDAASSGGAVRLLTVGPIPSTVTGLSSGNAGLIVVDDDGRTARYTSGDTTIVGWCYATGDAMIGAFPQSTPTTGEGTTEYQGPTLLNVTLEPYGAVGDGTTDDTAAIQAAIDDCMAANISATSPGYTVYFPPGTYKITSTLKVRAKCKLMGAYGGFDVMASQILAAADTTAIWCQGYIDGPSSGGTDWGYGAKIEDLYINSSGGTDVTKHGIILDGLNWLENVCVRGFPGDGVYANCDTGNGENMNFGRFENLKVQNCGGRGVHVVGGDVNAITASGVFVQNCVGGGIYDDCFLGNHWHGFMIEACLYTNGDGRLSGNTVTPSSNTTLGNSDRFVNFTGSGFTITLPPSPADGQIHRIAAPATCTPAASVTISGNGRTINGSSTYTMAMELEVLCVRAMDGVWEPWGFGFRNKKSGVAATSISGGYIENDNGVCYFYAPGIWVGGNMYSDGPANGMFSWDSDGAIMCQQRGFKRIRFSELGPSGKIGYARVIEQTTGNFYTMRQNVDQASVGWAYQPTSGQTGYFYLGYNNNYLYGGIAVSGARGREGKGRSWLPRGAVISPDSTFSSGRHITVGSAAPTSTHDRKAWRTGDIVFNSNGAAGTPMGWRCTENGGWASDGAWATSLSIETGDTVTGGGYLHTAISEPSAAATGTTTSGAEPTWPATYGQNVTGADGIVWENSGVVGPTFHPGPIWQSDQVYVGGNVTANTAYGVYNINVAPGTLTLPASPFTGQRYIVKSHSTTSGGSPLTIAGNGKNIDGSSSVTLTNAYEASTVIYSGSEWMRV